MEKVAVMHKLFVISAYSPAGGSTGIQNDESHDDRATHVYNRTGSDTIVVADIFNASESCFGGRCTLPAHCTDNGGVH